MAVPTKAPMTRYDCTTGYVICIGGWPYQAAYRAPSPEKVLRGLDDLECWLASIDVAMPQHIVDFLIANFRYELDLEWENRWQ